MGGYSVISEEDVSPKSQDSSASDYPEGMKEPGNINLTGRPVLHNSDGSISSERSFSIGTDKGETLLPLIVNGKQLTQPQAIDHFRKTGEHMGVFDTPDHADAYATKVHNRKLQSSGPATFIYRGDSSDESASGYQVVSEEDSAPAKVSPEVQRRISAVPRPQLKTMDGYAAVPVTSSHSPVDVTHPDQPESPFSLKDAVVGGMTDILTNPSPGAETGIPALGPEAVKSTHELATPGERVKGALRAANVGLEAASPLIGPAALESPINVARGMAEGYVAGKGAKKVAEKAGASPETADLAEGVGQLAPVVGESVFRPRFGLSTSPEGTGVSGSVRGAGAGVAVTPEEVVIRGGVGSKTGEIRIPRNGASQQPAIEPQTIQGEVVSAAQSMVRANTVETAARAAVKGVPIPSPVPPAPEPPAHITPETADAIGKQIAALPPDQRADAIIAAHGELAKSLLQKGKFIGPDGKLEVIKTPDQADSVAQRIINDQIAAHDKAADKFTQAAGGGRSAEEMPTQPSTSPANSVATSVAATRAAAKKVSSRNAEVSNVEPSVAANDKSPIVQPENTIPAESAGFTVVGEEPAPQPFNKGDQVRVAGVDSPAEVKHISDSSGVRIMRLQFKEPTKVPWSDKPVTKTSVPRKYQDGVKSAEGGQIIYARHGETALDQKGPKEIVAGHTPEPLDDRGVKSSENLADDLKDKGITHVVTSDLPRAAETAKIVADKLGVPVKEDERLRPQSVPETEGMTVGEAKPIWEDYKNNPDKKPKGGETHAEFEKRQDAAIDEVREDAKAGENPLVVTHSRNIEHEVGTRPEPGEFVEQKVKTETPLDKFEAEGREPWQVTQKEWVDLQKAHRGALGQAQTSGTRFAPTADWEEYHRDQVTSAVKAGKDVPAQVLKEYPDIQKFLPPSKREALKEGTNVEQKPQASEAVDNGDKIKQEQSNEQQTPAAEGNGPVSEPESGRGNKHARVESEASPATGKDRGAGEASGQRGGTGGSDLPESASGGTAARRGTGDGERSSVPDGGVDARGRGTRKPAVLKNSDWFSHPEDFSVDAGTSKRLEWNTKAITILKKVLSGETKLTDEDRDALAHYVGWGALQWAFDPYRSPYGEQKKWVDANGKLRDLMTDDEIQAARSSTRNAHFTSPEIVRFVWSAMKRAGFDGGSILEPSMGSGNFFGMMPKGIRSKVQAVGNELDPTTYNISKLLYPSATLFNKDFVQLMLPDNSLDLVVGNVPFGDEIFDPHYPKLKARIHDYFIVKSLDKLRPGGVAALITSTGTLDKPSSRVREIMANRADLVYALRFPAGTFEKTAGTHVTTDLLIFQKRQVGAEATGEPYTKVVPVEAPHEQDGGMAKDNLNEYFDKHPENMLGKLAISRRMYGSNDLVLTPDKSTPFAEQLKSALERVPRGLFDDMKSSPLFPAGEAVNLAPDHLIEGSYFLGPKGEIWQKRSGATVLNPFVGDLTATDKDRITKLIATRDALSDLLYTMKTVPNDDIGNREVSRKQKALLSTYKTYVDKHGLVRAPKAAKLFGADPHYPRLVALESLDVKAKKITPADIFTKRTVFPREQLSVLSQNPKDALFQVLNERGKPDMDFMAQLSGKDAKELAAELGKQGLIYREPVSGNYQMADEYLSGYVRDKLKDAKIAVEQGHKEYEPNVAALEKVIPADKPIERIAVKPGATWIPTDAIKEFLQTFLHAGRSVSVSSTSGTWRVEDAMRSAEIVSQHGNAEFPADELLQMALNLRQPTAYDVETYVDAEGATRDRRVVNQPRTLAARELQEKLTDNFSRWMKDHQEWAPKLARIYNDKYNNMVLPTTDGSHLTFPGADLSILRGGQFMTHQRDTIWRIIQHGRGLIAHVVGAGKTYQMIGSGMEMRRLGLARKILYAVPNHLVKQWSRDFLRLYPGANVLSVGESDFTAKNRQAAMAKIATNDWDAIIMPHSHFNMMDISPERQRITLQHDLDELEETIRGLEEQHGSSSSGMWGRGRKSADRAHQRTVKSLEASKDRLKQKIAQLSNLRSDRVINFDDTGIDQLYVDEAHEYKNLLFYTKMQRVAGLAQGNAKRATRLKMKTDYLLERNGNRGVVFATGTPVQNTMAEMYNMIRYVAPDVLEKAGIKYFDDWAANFGKVITALELSADAESYKPRSKFAEFSNVPELQMMFNSFADVKTNEDLPDLKAMLPKLEGGKPIVVEVENPEIEPIVKSLVRRAAALRGEPVPVFDDAGKPVMEEFTDPKTGRRGRRQVTEHLPRPRPDEDNMLSVVTEGRLAATDMRLLYPSATGKHGKIYKVAEKVIQEYKDGAANKVTQLVFIDRFRRTNKATRKEEFNLYRELTNELIKGGIKAKEIAVIHDYDTNDKKLALFDEVNAGNIRVLMGSSQKMGAGMNVQTRLVANHHVDFPWKPGELDQREGRLIRQGNTNDTVRSYWYATKKSFDAYMGQTLQGKAKFIWQILAGKNVGDSVTDAASDSVLSYEEMKAIASGNPDVKLKMELEAKIRKMEILSEQHEAALRDREGMIESEHNRVATLEAGKQAMVMAQNNYQQAAGKDGKQFSLDILGKKYTDRAEALKAIEKEPPPIFNIHVTLQGLPVVIEPKINYESSGFVDWLKSNPGGTVETYRAGVAASNGIRALEYRLPYPTVYYNSANDVDGLTNSTYGAPEANLASVIRSAESVIRNLPKTIASVDKAIEFKNQRIARLEELKKEGRSTDDKELRATKRELQEVNQRLGIDEFRAAQEQEVAVDIDTSGDDEEDDNQDERLIDRLRGESGSFEPGKIGEAASAVKGYIDSISESTHIARGIQRGLETLDTQKQADALRGKQFMEKAFENGLTKNDDEAVYHHLENPEEALTPSQESVLDDMILPLREQNTELYKEASQGGLPIDNYVGRVVKGRGGLLDRVAQGVKSIGKKNTLSRTAPQLKTRTMMAIESPNGERRVVSIKGGEATMWVAGEPTRLGEIKNAKGKVVEGDEARPLSAFFDKGYFVEGPDGYDWKIGQATTKEIEANTSTRYYHSALASLVASNIQLRSAVRAQKYLESLKESDDFKEIAWRGRGNPPSGWRATTLPQFVGYYFEPRTAEVLNQYHERIQGGDATAFDKVGAFMRVAMLVNPIMHPLNVATSWAVEKGVTGFMPQNWITLAKTGSKAVQAVLHQNDDFLAALDAGGAVQSQNQATADLAKLFFEQLADGLGKNESWALRIAKSLGFDPKHFAPILAPMHKISSKIAWASNDMFLLQSAYQFQAKHPGTSLNDALREAGRIIPEYRLPTRIGDSKFAADLMRNRWATIFGAYHYGLLKSFGEIGRSALGLHEPIGEQSKGADVRKGWDRLAMLGLLAFALFPALDELAKKLTGDKHAHVRRTGPLGVVDAVQGVASGTKDIGTAVQQVVTPAPHTKAAVEVLFNRDLYNGQEIRDPHASFDDQVSETGRWLLQQIGQLGQAYRASESEPEKKKFLLGQVGIQLRRTPAEKLASDLAAHRFGVHADTPEEREKYSERHEILDALRKGNDTPLKHAIERQELTHKQAETIRHRAKLTPLQDSADRLGYSDFFKVYKVADDEEKKQLRPLLARKRASALEHGHRQEVNAAESR